jgi:DNA-binding NarL/FixJ family response regulator
MLRCLIVDDSPSFLDAATSLLQREGIEVVGRASSIATGLREAEKLQPDIVLVDVMLGAESGFVLARRLHEQNGHATKVILISTHAEADLADLIEATPGAGFVPKSRLSASAIQQVVSESRGR